MFGFVELSVDSRPRLAVVDNITHSLFGALLSKAGLEKLTPYATPLCVAAANAPDLDIVSGVDPAAYLVWHRHLTHGFAAIPLMAAVAVAVTWAGVWVLAKILRRRPVALPLKRAWLAALLPAASHPLLDWTNSYGLRPWLPFSAEWTSLDLLFIVDFYVWGILLAGAIGAYVWRKRARLAAGIGLAAFGFYLMLSIHWHAKALQAVQRLDATAARTAAWPAPWNPFLWVGWAEIDGQDVWVPIDLRAPDLSEAEFHDRPKRPALVERAWETRLGLAYAQFVRYPLVRVDGNQVTLSDFRFYRFGRVGFACNIAFDEAGDVLRERFEF